MRARLAVLLISIALIALAVPSTAHQPFFEGADITADDPWQIIDPQVSTAVYCTLDSPDDVDYFSFNASRGESIFLSITIPQITGQDNFAPTMALIGRGLSQGDLPGKVSGLKNTGALILPPPKNATAFYEPFSKTSYWTRQEDNVTIPDIGRYIVAVWDDSGMVGRYAFVIGTKEVLGGDLLFPMKMRKYWTPVNRSAYGIASPNQTNASSPGAGTTGRKTQPGFEAVLVLIGIGISAACMWRHSKG